MTDLFIKPEYLAEIIEIIKNSYPKAIIWAYGSRTNGTAHEGSDLDLVIKDYGQEETDYLLLKEALQESNIPFLIDIFEFDKLPESFQKNIKKNYIVLYNGQIWENEKFKKHKPEI